MSTEPPLHAILDALHDGTIDWLRREADGSILMQVDIGYLADRLEAGSSTIRTRFIDASTPTVEFYEDAYPAGMSPPEDLLAADDLGLTFLSVSEGPVAPGEEVTLHCVSGTLRLSFSTLSFETESGVALTTETLQRASRLYWERWSARGAAHKLDLHMRSATPNDLPVLRGLYSELLGVLATYNPTVDPTHELQSDWVKKPEKLFTWLFHRRDESGRFVPVGMALVCGRAYTEALGGKGDFWLYEFVISEKERRQGLGQAGLALVLDAHEGEWCLDVLPQNAPAMGFWTAALDHYEPRTFQRTDDEGVEFTRFEFHTRVPLA